MNLKEYCEYDGLGLAELVQKKEVKPSELCNLSIEAIKKVDGEVNSVIEYYRDRAETADDVIDTSAPFAGVPFYLKDLSGEKGRLVEMGCRMFKGNRAEADSYEILRFREAGLVIMGRCTAPEFGGGGSTITTMHGITRNPYDLERSSGGSSGGSASLVSSGIAPLTHAGDGGGSTRYPASCCNLVGLKASRGLVSPGPEANDMMAPVQNKFCVSQTVRDSAALLDAVCGPEPGEAFDYRKPDVPFLKQIEKPRTGLRIALSQHGWTDLAPVKDVADQIEDFARTLEDMGHTVEELKEPPMDMVKAHVDYNTGALAIFASKIKAASETTGKPINSDYLEAVTLKYYEEGCKYGVSDYFKFINMTNTVARKFAPLFETYDILLTPTSGAKVRPLNEQSMLRTDIGGREFLTAGFMESPYLAPFNLSGMPGLSVPTGLDKDNLPIGAQFVGPIGSDGLLLNLAAQVEQARPWRHLRPPVFAGTA